MRRTLITLCALVLSATVVVISGTFASGSAGETASGHPLATAVLDSELWGGEKEAAAAQTRKAGASFVRLVLPWQGVAPADKPSVRWNPRNPGDPRYNWSWFDGVLRASVDAGLKPIVSIQYAPTWALQKGCGIAWTTSCLPSPSALADFATAVARRYAGGNEGRPRVRHWQVWNEPNLPPYLMPQYDAKGRLVSPNWYRSMVNAAADAIHAVNAANVVIAGGQSPFGPDAQSPDRAAPLAFMRQLLCLSAGKNPKPVCRKRVRFDIWAHHPYTSGSPTHRANNAGDVSLPDLWRMKALLDTAVKTGNLQSRGQVGFWVTEFGWDTSPPDPKGVPEELHARWVAEALYRMWNQGVSLVTWFLIRDQPFGEKTPFQSGLYFRGPNGIASDTPKLALTAFRFPFVAFREPKKRSVMYWGRSPAGRSAVVVEQKRQGGWGVVETLRPNSFGIFSGRYTSTAQEGFLRARLTNGKDEALPFSLVVPPDRPGCIWGTC